MGKRLLRVLLFLTFGYGLLVIAIYFLQEKLLFHPEKLPARYQFEFSFPFKELHISTTPEATINGLYFQAEKSQGLVLYFHGNAGSLRTWGGVAQDFLVCNYDVLMIDYRGYGKSTGKLSEEALYNDAQKVFQYVSKHISFDKVVIYGRSLGTGIATKVAAENEVDLLILESPYYSMLDLANNWMPWLPQKWILKYPMRTDVYLLQVKCPIFIFHGDQDKTIYPGSSLKLSRSFKSGDELFPISGAGHNNIGLFQEYHRKLKEVLSRRIDKEDDTLF